MADRAILVCGTGVGASMAANRIPGIRAFVGHDTYSARQAVEHDDANVMCLGAWVIGPETMRLSIEAFLGAEFSFGTIVQYWRSFEDLEAYAKDRDALHYPAWKEFNTKVRSNGDVGIWHETYKVHAGEYECIYNNMPPKGLGKVGELVPISGKLESAGDRIK